MLNGKEMRAVMASMPLEIRQWLIHFGEVLRTQDAGNIFCSLVQVGIDDPAACLCDRPHGEELVWLHKHHREFNLIIWSMLQNTPVVATLRAAVEADLQVPDSEDPGMKGFGDVVSRTFGRWMLEHFLVEKPTCVPV